jgi:hypothetical protein
MQLPTLEAAVPPRPLNRRPADPNQLGRAPAIEACAIRGKVLVAINQEPFARRAREIDVRAPRPSHLRILTPVFGH